MSRRLFSLCMLVFLILPLALQPWQAARAQESDPPTAPEGNTIVIIHYPDRATLESLAGELDIWEVDPEAGSLVAMVTPAEYASLVERGLQIEIDTARMEELNAPPGYPCYRTIVDLYADLQTRAQAYPGLTYLRSIGKSYEGRDIWSMRVTNESHVVADKPRLFLMANIHGRELITPEMAMVFMDHLLENYGVDPDVTWILDWHEIYIVVSANPDGHVRNETTLAYWRKNTHPYGSCSPDSIGVDLNRNHSFKWGLGVGSSGDPCDETYRGPSNASEAETQLIQNYVRSLFPDQRGPGDTDAAPEDATGVLISLHSYSNLILWPWGWTNATAPNSAGLAALGQKMATYNYYDPQQSNALYLTDGSTDDWSYGELGIASYTFEMGSSFYPSCSQYDSLIQPNIPAILYAARVADTPYITSRGPDALNLVVTPDEVVGAWPVHLAAQINDTQNGNKAIQQAEYSIDLPPWAGGTAVSMTPVDGAFNTASEAVQAEVDTRALTGGRHILYVRGQDITGYWGPVSAVFLWVDNNGLVNGSVTRAADAQPIAGASVTLNDGALTYTAASDGAGYYATLADVGVYTATAEAFGYAPEVVAGVVVSPGLTTTVDFSMTLLMTGTLNGFVYELGTNQPLQALIEVQGTPVTTTSSAESGAFALNLPTGSYTLQVSAPGHVTRTLGSAVVTAGETSSIAVPLALPNCVLMVDDDYVNSSLPSGYETFYTQALLESGLTYDRWSVANQGSPAAADMEDYPVVLWFTGDAAVNTLTAPDQSALTSYLNGGGAALFTGQDIAWDIRSDPGNFLGNMLRASAIADDAAAEALSGAGLYAGLDFALNGGDGANNQTNPDLLSPLASATAVFTYTTGTGGLAVETGDYRAILLGYGVEGVDHDAARSTLLADGLGWLGCAPAPVDLQIGLDGPAGPLAVGELVTYTLTLTNASGVPLVGMLVSDTLPAGAAFVSAEPAAEVVDGQVRWTGLAQAAETAQTLTLVTRILAEAQGGEVVNADYGAQITQAGGLVVTGTQAVHTAVSVTPVADLELSLEAEPEAVAYGGVVTYTLVITNHGPQDAHGVVLSDTLPAGAGFIQASAGCVYAEGLVTCSLGDLAAENSLIIEIAARAPSTWAALVNTATVMADEIDTVADNHTQQIETAVQQYQNWLPVVLRTTQE